MRASELSGREIVALGKKLRSRYAVLWKKLSTRSEFEGLVEPAVHDTQDESWADEQEDERLAEMRHDGVELDDIRQALMRLHTETYGICQDCGTPIGYSRLEAYPTAKRCLSCQRRHELKAG